MLSPQERRVLELLKQGLKTQEIAVRLDISPLTAQNYITSLRRKLASQC
jgi:DNA-binding CsgD family transcriptional regulator